jgi:PAS domain S-box-containing protein
VERQILEAAPDAVIVVDRQGTIRFVNRQAEQLFGYGRHELVGNPVEKLVPDRFAGAHGSHRVGYFENPRTRTMGAGLELFGRRKDGSEFPVDVSLSHTERPGEPLATAFVRDITDRKRAEDRMRLANRDLESFSHTISHDLRAPLRAIMGFGQALLEDYAGVLDARGRDFLDRMVRAGASMEDLIDDLLDYSRIGRLQVETRPVDVEAVVRAVLRGLGAEIEKSGAHVEPIGPFHRAMAEPQLLEQALTNLVSNALKYVPPGTRPSVRLRGQKTGGRVRVIVEDDGIGIAPEHMGRIWRPFERLHSAREYPGTGVGLAIVERAVERMGGSAGAESSLGVGSRFWVELASAPEETG